MEDWDKKENEKIKQLEEIVKKTQESVKIVLQTTKDLKLDYDLIKGKYEISDKMFESQAKANDLQVLHNTATDDIIESLYDEIIRLKREVERLGGTKTG